MCRYAMGAYKQHFVCVPCRFAAKGLDSWQEESRCPHCQQDMVAMGRDFKPPRKKSNNQWKKIAVLVQHGALFVSCGCRGPGHRPKTFADAKRAFNGR